MKITKLLAKNFMALGRVELDNIDSMGLVLLQGVNKDDPSASSNGAGKSSVVDAISWCLWGETARGESGDSVVSDVTGNNCVVMLSLEDGSDYYRITRHRKHAVGKNSLLVHQVSGGVAKDLTQGTTELTQAIVERVMGCKADVFNAAIYAGQEKMPDLPSMTDKALKVIVEQAAGIDRLQAAHEISRQKRAEAASGFELANISADTLARQLIDDASLLGDTNKKRAEWDAARAVNVTACEKQADHATELLAIATDKANHSRSVITTLNIEASSVRARIDGVTGEKKRAGELRLEAQALDRSFQFAKSAAKSKMDELTRAKTHLSNIAHKVGSPCGECTKTYGVEDLAGATGAATNRIKDLTADAHRLALAARETQEKLTASQQALAAFEASMTDVSAEVARERAVSSQIATEQRVVDSVASAETALGNAREALKREQSLVNPFIASVKSHEERLASRQTQLLVAKAKLAEAEAKLELTEKAVKVFGPLGVRGLILDTVTPFLNDRTAHYLGVLSDGNINATWTTLSKTAKGEVREKFAIEVTNTKGGKKFGLLSGGEKRKVRLASAMALQDLVAARATKPLNIFIADEIDHALDAAGLERLMGILEEKAKEKGSVIVVSHSDLRDWIRNVITVVKEGGVARVEVETA